MIGERPGIFVVNCEKVSYSFCVIRANLTMVEIPYEKNETEENT